MTRLPTLGPRGEGWVLAQGVLLVAIAVAGFGANGAWRGELRFATTGIALVLWFAGGLLAVGGLVGLRENLTALPAPKADGRLIESGAYGLVRHPIYGGIVLGALGWGLFAASPAALLGAAILLGFFDLKARREEAWLDATYPGYPAYRARTRRLIPWLY